MKGWITRNGMNSMEWDRISWNGMEFMEYDGLQGMGWITRNGILCIGMDYME
jgi:hypothetical protein